MKPAYTRMVSVCFIISLLTTAYPVSTTFLNLQKLSGPAYTDAAFSLSITNSEAFAETLGLILGGNAFPKLLQNTVFHVFSFVIDLCSAGISIFLMSLEQSMHFYRTVRHIFCISYNRTVYNISLSTVCELCAYHRRNAVFS